MDKSECLQVVSSIGAARHTRRHVWQRLWCMQVLVTVVSLTNGVALQYMSDLHTLVTEVLGHRDPHSTDPGQLHMPCNHQRTFLRLHCGVNLCNGRTQTHCPITDFFSEAAENFSVYWALALGAY